MAPHEFHGLFLHTPQHVVGLDMQVEVWDYEPPVGLALYGDGVSRALPTASAHCAMVRTSSLWLWNCCRLARVGSSWDGPGKWEIVTSGAGKCREQRCFCQPSEYGVFSPAKALRTSCPPIQTDQDCMPLIFCRALSRRRISVPPFRGGI